MLSREVLVPELVREYAVDAVRDAVEEIGLKTYCAYPVNSWVRGYARETSDYRIVVVSPDLDLRITVPRRRVYEYGEVVFSSVRKFLRSLYRGSVNSVLMLVLILSDLYVLDRNLNEFLKKYVLELRDLTPKLRTVYEKAQDIITTPPHKYGRACFMVFTARFVTALAGTQDPVQAYEVTYQSMSDVREFRTRATSPEEIVTQFSRDLDLAKKICERMVSELEKVEVHRSTFNRIYYSLITEYVRSRPLS